MTRKLTPWLMAPLGLALASCFAGHTARVKQQPLPPLPDPITRHGSRLYIQLPEEGLADSQCVAFEGYQTLCFDGVRAALEKSLKSLLWPSYPEVELREHADELRPGDYLLQVELNLDALPPDASRHGWSAGAKGRWRVVRDGLPLVGETLATRSRGDFAYGSGLGLAAGEVVDAVAAHIADVLVRLPETKAPPLVLLPPVVANNSHDADTSTGASDAEAPPSENGNPPASVQAKSSDGSQAKQR